MNGPQYDRLVFDDDVDLETVRKAEHALKEAGIEVYTNETEAGHEWRFYRDSEAFDLREKRDGEGHLTIRKGDGEKVREAERLLGDAGIRFDTGGGFTGDNVELCRDWCLDFSLVGATIEFGFCHNCERQSCGENQQLTGWSG